MRAGVLPRHRPPTHLPEERRVTPRLERVTYLPPLPASQPPPPAHGCCGNVRGAGLHLPSICAWTLGQSGRVALDVFGLGVFSKAPLGSSLVLSPSPLGWGRCVCDSAWFGGESLSSPHPRQLNPGILCAWPSSLITVAALGLPLLQWPPVYRGFLHSLSANLCAEPLTRR